MCVSPQRCMHAASFECAWIYTACLPHGTLALCPSRPIMLRQRTHRRAPAHAALQCRGANPKLSCCSSDHLSAACVAPKPALRRQRRLVMPASWGVAVHAAPARTGGCVVACSREPGSVRRGNLHVGVKCLLGESRCSCICANKPSVCAVAQRRQYKLLQPLAERHVAGSAAPVIDMFGTESEHWLGDRHHDPPCARGPC